MPDEASKKKLYREVLELAADCVALWKPLSYKERQEAIVRYHKLLRKLDGKKLPDVTGKEVI